jgi:NitT/TauT family transport system ATP-binding protein
MIIDSVSKSFSVGGKALDVLVNFSLTIPPGSITAFVGPSGCGKTTLLRLIGDLEQCDQGSIIKDASEEGPFSYLFQEPRLLPWHSVVSNVELALRDWYPDRKQRIERSMEFLSMVGLEGYARFTPDQLSGGMRQRVAIARAFAYPGHIMLLDEPFQSLDTHLRWSLVDAFLTLWKADKRTTVYVTHDVPEALLMADTVVRLSSRPMQILQTYALETPREQRSLGHQECIQIQRDFYTYP